MCAGPIAVILVFALISILYDFVVKAKNKADTTPGAEAASAFLHLILSALGAGVLTFVFIILVIDFWRQAFLVLWIVVWLVTRPMWKASQDAARGGPGEGA